MLGSIGQVGSSARTNAVSGEDRKKLNAGGTPSINNTTSANGDKLEISSEAIKMRAEAQQGGTPLVRGSESETNRIKNNIASGFYNSPSVQRAVASKINQMLPGTDH